MRRSNPKQAVGEADPPIRRGRIKAIFITEAQSTQRKIGQGKAKEEGSFRISSGLNFCFDLFFKTSESSVSLW
jgi:hypothetical protein